MDNFNQKMEKNLVLYINLGAHIHCWKATLNSVVNDELGLYTGIYAHFMFFCYPNVVDVFVFSDYALLHYWVY